MMKITLKDGSVKEYESKKTVIDIARDLSEGLARAATAANQMRTRTKIRKFSLAVKADFRILGQIPD